MIRVMVVDDALYMRFTYRRILKDTEAEIVAEAENGYEAISLYKKERPDYVLLDLTMPGLSGQDVLEEILKIDPAAKVIVVSAMGQDIFIKNCLQRGARSFIIKPFKEKLLLTQLGIAKPE